MPRNLENKLKTGARIESIPITERGKLLSSAKYTIVRNAPRIEPPFGLMLYGSIVYGTNEHSFGNLDDIDSLAVAKRTIKTDEIIDTVSEIFQTTNGVKDPEILSDSVDQFRAGAIDQFRVAGKYNHFIPFSIYFIDLTAFRSGFSSASIDKAYPSIFPNKPKYYGRTGYDMKNGNYVFTPERHEPIDENTTVVYQKFSPRNKDGNIVLGVLANKFLTGEIIHDPSDIDLTQTLKTHTRTFIRSAIHFRPDISDTQIIGLITRNERFSKEFTENLLHKIRIERDILEKRKHS